MGWGNPQRPASVVPLGRSPWAAVQLSPSPLLPDIPAPGHLGSAGNAPGDPTEQAFCHPAHGLGAGGTPRPACCFPLFLLVASWPGRLAWPGQGLLSSRSQSTGLPAEGPQVPLTSVTCLLPHLPFLREGGNVNGKVVFLGKHGFPSGVGSHPVLPLYPVLLKQSG